MAYSCCSIRSCITCITFINMLWVSLMMMDHFMVRLSSYYQYSNKYASYKNNTLLSFEQEENPQLYHNYHTYYTGGRLNRKELKPLLKDSFMDYILILKMTWCAMEFLLNIGLSKTTIKVSPEKIYAWLVIYYAHLIEALIFEIHIFMNDSVRFRPGYWSHVMQDADYLSIFDIILVVVELFIVQQYYSKQKIAALINPVEIKFQPRSEIHTTTRKITIYRYDETENGTTYVPLFVNNLRNASA